MVFPGDSKLTGLVVQCKGLRLHCCLGSIVLGIAQVPAVLEVSSDSQGPLGPYTMVLMG